MLDGVRIIPINFLQKGPTFVRRLVRILSGILVILHLCLPLFAQDGATRLSSSAQKMIDRLDREGLALAEARATIARWYCRNRKYDEASAQATALRPRERVQLLAVIAQLAVNANDNEAADRMMSEALSLLEKHDEDEASFGDVMFSEIALNNGNLTLASKFISIMEEGSEKKARALLKLALAHAKSNDRKQAVQCTEAALAQVCGFDEDEQSKVIEVTVEAAKVMVAAGDLERGRQLALKANTALLAQSENDTSDQVYVAQALAAVGNLSQAVSMVEAMEEGRISGFISLSVNCSDKDTARLLLDRARDLTLHLVKEESYSQSLSLSDLVSVYLRANLLDEAKELLPKIKETYHLHSAAVGIADDLRQRGKSDEAEAVLDIARDAAEKIISEKSEDIPSHASFSNAQSKSQILSRLVESYVVLGSLSRAELAARAIDQPQYRASALSKVAVAHFAGGDTNKARSLLLRALELSTKAKDYRHDRFRELSLFDVSWAMSQAGFASDFAKAITRFLEQVDKSELADQFLAELFILGELSEANGGSLNPKSLALLKRIETQIDK